MRDTRKTQRKVTVLISKIEEDCRQNIQNLIKDGRQAALTWNIEWESPTWDVQKVFAHTVRSHRSERTTMNFWFTERGERPKVPGKPFEKTFGEIVRSLLVLRHQVGNQCFVDQQQIIIASQFISQQLAGRNHDLTKLTSGDLEYACDQIATSQAKSTAYKLQRFVEEIGATIDRNRLCPRLLNFRYSKKKRPETVSGIDYVRLDDPDLAKGASAKLLPEMVLKALGHLYQSIPETETSDRLRINAAVIAACTGRRIGEILTLPKQNVSYDRNGYAYILYYKEKRSQGCQTINLDKLYLIPQTVPLIDAVIEESIKLTSECRAIAKHIEESGGANTTGLLEGQYLEARDLGSFLGITNASAKQWFKFRNVPPYGQERRSYVYNRSAIVAAMQNEIYHGPAVHVTPPGKNLELEDVLFIGFKNAFHARKASLKYAVWPVNVRHMGDFLGARGCGAFKRYFSGENESNFRINSHRFRHTLNTILQRGGMSDALQTEWFARKNPSDSKAYQHMTPAEKAYAAHISTAKRFNAQPSPPEAVPRGEATTFAQNMVVLDLGLGLCRHDWRNRPCGRYEEMSLAPESLVWEAPEFSTRLPELERIQHFIETMLHNALHRADIGMTEAIQWADVFRKKLSEIQLIIASLKSESGQSNPLKASH